MLEKIDEIRAICSIVTDETVGTKKSGGLRYLLDVLTDEKIYIFDLKLVNGPIVKNVGIYQIELDKKEEFLRQLYSPLIKKHIFWFEKGKGDEEFALYYTWLQKTFEILDKEA